MAIVHNLRLPVVLGAAIAAPSALVFSSPFRPW